MTINLDNEGKSGHDSASNVPASKTFKNEKLKLLFDALVQKGINFDGTRSKKYKNRKFAKTNKICLPNNGLSLIPNYRPKHAELNSLNKDRWRNDISSVERIKLNISKIANITNESALPSVKITLVKPEKSQFLSQPSGRSKLNIELTTPRSSNEYSDSHSKLQTKRKLNIGVNLTSKLSHVSHEHSMRKSKSVLKSKLAIAGRKKNLLEEYTFKINQLIQDKYSSVKERASSLSKMSDMIESSLQNSPKIVKNENQSISFSLSHHKTL